MFRLSCGEFFAAKNKGKSHKAWLTSLCDLPKDQAAAFCGSLYLQVVMLYDGNS